MSSSDLKTLVPTFIVYVNGSRIAIQQEASVKSVLVIDRLDAPCQLLLTLSDPKQQWSNSKEFSEGNKISVKLGYKDHVHEVFNGEITGQTVELRRGADCITTIRGQTVLHKLVGERKTAFYKHMSEHDVAKKIVSNVGLNMEGDSFGSHKHFIAQRHMNDFEFLSFLARRFGCRMWAEEDKVIIKKDSERSDDVVLEWGKTLISFQVTANATRVATEVEVHGMDQHKNKIIIGKAKTAQVAQKIGGDELGGKIRTDNFGDSTLTIFDKNISDPNEAEDLAKEIITQKSFGFIRGEGRCEGEARLVAGATVKIKEAGGRFSGEYVLDSVRHTFDPIQGFTSTFYVVRNAV